ncbi:MAG: HD domain-containing protein, partial [Oscillospiraceae bacterium]|nr:HD domain-containing protein [Oscillospiraceae bacterium]
CGLLALFILITKAISKRRKWIMLSLELSSMFLLIFDRFAYFFRGHAGPIGYWMVRISNFAVYMFTIAIPLIFTIYLIDIVADGEKYEKAPKRLRHSCYVAFIAFAVLIISQFTGFYYTFDEFNCYQRSYGFMISYIFPLGILLIDLSVVIQNYRRLGRFLGLTLLLFSIVPTAASVLQFFVYGISFTEMSLVGMAMITYIMSLVDTNDMIEQANMREIEHEREERRNIKLLFEQTASALANAIDAKDKYTHGHSRRVAKYSEKIAHYAGKTDKECEDIYFAALLHDVGKIGIQDSIINKEGKLTDEEYAIIKSHPVIGKQILSSISQSPYLSLGANYHHERYDGNGYPEGLKGEDIPDLARIIAVADAYDAMTSKRSYRDPIPQQIVREEFVKGIGTQFDPVYAKIMIHFIDFDSEYQMKEREDPYEIEADTSLVCSRYRSSATAGILLTSTFTHIRLTTKMNDGFKEANFIPTFIIFDSLDARVYEDEKKRADLLYFEYATVRADGVTEIKEARNVKTDSKDLNSTAEETKAFRNGAVTIELDAVRFKDHALIRMTNGYRSHEIIIALTDSTRFAYISLTGEHCTLTDIDVTKTGEEIGEDYIPRISEEISYINVPAGDIPNVQVDGWRAASSEKIQVTDGMKISFHTMSLPTARLIWHCPFAVLFTYDDGKEDDEHYRELTVLRLDGEGWEEDEDADNQVSITKLDSFTDWNDWKLKNKSGLDCELTYHTENGKVIIETQFCGLSIRSTTTYDEKFPVIYTCLTGDQCAITNIRIKR